MSGVCDCCGAPQQKRVERGALVAIDEPYTLFWKGERVPLYASEARVAFELVRWGQISIERICLLAPLAEDGNDECLAHNRICRIRAKLRAAGAAVEIASRRNFGWELRLSPAASSE
ncbi:MAG: hypothetical protein PGN16_03650 [Sphingomonas phyllosphaerae]|uniref:hypothetical protein n=1 Tax=Sphingomonas phyllosphaerae TaxID=257003 RepID=UPI002FF9900F